MTAPVTNNREIQSMCVRNRDLGQKGLKLGLVEIRAKSVADLGLALVQQDEQGLQLRRPPLVFPRPPRREHTPKVLHQHRRRLLPQSPLSRCRHGALLATPTTAFFQKPIETNLN